MPENVGGDPVLVVGAPSQRPGSDSVQGRQRCGLRALFRVVRETELDETELDEVFVWSGNRAFF